MNLPGDMARLVTAGAVTVALTASGVATASLAQAGTAGSWTGVSSANLKNIEGPSLVRLPAGQRSQLLVTWTDNPAATGYREYNLRSRLITTTGANGSAVKNVVARWVGLDDKPTPLLLGGKPAVAFSGTRTLGSGDVFSSRGALATSAAGTSWSLRSTPITTTNSVYGGYGFDAIDYQGKPLVAFTQGSADHFSYSLDGADFEGTPITGSYVYDVALAKDPKTGAVWSAFTTLGNSTNKRSGVWVQRIKPSFTRPVRAPGSVDSQGNLPVDLNSVAFSASSAGGVYLAYVTGYPFGTGVRVWKVGTSTYRHFATTDAGFVSLTSGPAGRLWVSWEDSDGRLHAVRSNKARTAWGLRQSVKEPTRFGISKTATEGSLGRLDIVTLGATSTGNHALFHTQLKGGLTVKLSKARVRSSTGGKIVVTVKDAGTAVKGAKVVYRGTSHLTNAKGQVTLRVATKTKKGTKTIRVTRAGYTKAIKTFRVI